MTQATAGAASQRLVSDEAWRDFLPTIFDIADVGICITNADRLIVAANRAWLSTYGYEIEEVLGQSFTLVVPEADRAMAVAMHDDFLFGGLQEIPGEWQVVRKDGSPRTVLVTARHFKDSQGAPYKLTTVSDITRRKEMEAALSRSESRFRTLMDTSVDWYWETDGDGMLTFVSRGSRAQAGFAPESLVGQRLVDSLCANDERLRLAGMMMTRQPFSDLQVQVHPSSTQRPVVLHLSGVPSPDGRGYRGVARDVTAQLDTLETENRERRQEALGRMAGSLAHEINNLLQPLMNYLHLAQRDPGQLDGAVRIARTLRDLCVDILGLSREGPRSGLGVPLGEVFPRMESWLQTLVPAPMTLTVDVADADMRLPLTETELTRIMVNLVRNAVDACRGADEAVISINVRLAPLAPQDAAARGLKPGAHCALSVSDTGAGMDRETIDRLFDPFFTTKAPGVGTGLGLPSVHALVRAVGGRIDVTSRPGEGSRFDLLIPLSPS